MENNMQMNTVNRATRMRYILMNAFLFVTILHLCLNIDIVASATDRNIKIMLLLTVLFSVSSLSLWVGRVFYKRQAPKGGMPNFFIWVIVIMSYQLSAIGKTVTEYAFPNRLSQSTEITTYHDT